jgi:hypothetical protein
MQGMESHHIKYREHSRLTGFSLTRSADFVNSASSVNPAVRWLFTMLSAAIRSDRQRYFSPCFMYFWQLLVRNYLNHWENRDNKNKLQLSRSLRDRWERDAEILETNKNWFITIVLFLISTCSIISIIFQTRELPPILGISIWRVCMCVCFPLRKKKKIKKQKEKNIYIFYTYILYVYFICIHIFICIAYII